VSKLARIGAAIAVLLGLSIGVAELVRPTTALITAGPSRESCIYPRTSGGDLQPALLSTEFAIGMSVSCVSAYLDGATSWAEWEDPWITEPQKGYTSWVRAEPQDRQLVLALDLIPDTLEDQNDPLIWEQSCAKGRFDHYAKRLGTNLVAAGLGYSVLRLGPEMNGPWEPDFMGNTVSEQKLWASCFANEVTAFREAPGEHFLVVWNPNACTENIPYLNYYPGNAYVDILGLDLFDGVCAAPTGSTTPITWNQLANEPAGLASFEAFAKVQNKPMSFPEWGLLRDPNGDDQAYINGIGSTFTKGDFAFESYFDAGDGETLQLGPATRLSLAAFQKWFDNTTN
jgi:Glycosyl hydrolase family 26